MAQEKSVLTAEADRTQGVFDPVIVDFPVAIFAIGTQRGQVIQGVAPRFTKWTLS
jgi:hypothetical protein